MAAPPPVTTTVPSTLTVQPVTGNFSTPTPVTAVLTNPGTGTPIVNEPVTFTLNGSETCTANTDSTGTATCDITASEPSSSYTLSASFPGDTTTTTPIGSNSSTSTFTVNPDTTALTYTGATTAVNGSSTTLSGTLTTDTPTLGTPLPTKVVTFTIGSGSTAQSCSGTTDASGNVSCAVPTVDQPQTAETVTSTFTGDAYDTPVAVTTPITVTEPTSLTVNPATGNYSEPTTVSGVLQDVITNTPIVGEPVTFTLNGSETCTGTTDATGTASCSVTPGEPAATYTLTGTFGGDSTLPLQTIPSSGTASFIVTPEPTTLTYTGGITTQNGQPLTVSGVLTTETNTPISGQPVTFTLGSGTTAQTCSAVSTSTGAVSCVINVTGQPQGPIPVTDSFGGSSYYQPSTANATVNLPEGTTLTVSPGSGTYNTPGTVSGTLVNTVTNAPVPNEPVTLTVNGTQTCTATTNASGVASCSITPNEPGGTYTLTGSFGGDTTTVPTLLPSTGKSTFTENKAPTTVTYTGSTSITSGGTPTLSATLTGNGSPLARTDSDLHGRLGQLGPALQWHDQLVRQGELQHLHVQPVGQPAARHRDVRGQHLLRRIDDVAGDHRDDTHLAVGQRRHRHHGLAHHAQRHPDQRGHGSGDRRADRHLDAERGPVLHGDDQRLREGVVLRHAHRVGGDVPGDRVVRRQHDDVAPATAQ